MSDFRFDEKFQVVDSAGAMHNAVARIDAETTKVAFHLMDGREIRVVDETELRYEIARTGEALTRVS